LVAVVTKNNENCGLLFNAIGGNGLSGLRWTLDDKCSVAQKILQALVHLESRSDFPQDLKLANIMLRRVCKSFVISVLDICSKWMASGQKNQAYWIR
jgi:hypothetical protein